MKILKTIELDRFQHALAIAHIKAKSIADGFLENVKNEFPNPDDVPTEVISGIIANDKVSESITFSFMESLKKDIDDKYENHVLKIDAKIGKIEILDELMENVSDSNISMDELMENCGVQNADDYFRA